jgi:hypothetical protein
MFEDSPVFGNFKLCLQSAVCHRGTSVDSGHYISIVRRPASEKSNGNGSSSNSDSDITSSDRWMRLDDLAKERVAFVDVEEFLQKESPYLLFYQVQPIEGDPGNITFIRKTLNLDGPPSYTESERRDSGVPELSSSFGTDGDTTNVTKRSHDETPLPGGQSLPSNIVDRAQGKPTAQPTPSGHNSIALPNPPVIAGGAESCLGVASHGVARGRPARRNSHNGLSRSLSRFAGKLKKDKGDDVAARTGAVSLDQDTPSVSTEAAPAHDRSNAMQGYVGEQGARSEHVEYSDHAKEKRKTEKPDRQCMLM